jgi:hypothetical protein
MTYYLSLADATISRNNDEIEVYVVGGFDTIDDARKCLLKIVRHFISVMFEDRDDYYKNLDDHAAIDLFNERNRRGGSWFISEDLWSPEDFVSDYYRRRMLVGAGITKIAPQETDRGLIHPDSAKSEEDLLAEIKATIARLTHDPRSTQSRSAQTDNAGPNAVARIGTAIEAAIPGEADKR